MHYSIQRRLLALMLLTITAVIGIGAYAAPTEDIVYYHNDILGNPLAATDESGNVIWQESYTAYGEKAIEDEASDNNPLAFTGHYQDRESGLVYMGARYYSPELGRFLSPDPAEFTGQVESNPMLFNRYAYANNNPYKYTDPDGESPIEIATELLPAAGRSFAALALYANGMISNDQAMMGVALEVMHENQAESIFAIAAVVAPPGAGKAYRIAEKTKSNSRSTAELVQEVATRSERKIGGSGAAAGTKKHAYAKRLMDRYQRRYGGDLQTEISFKGNAVSKYGEKGSTRLDVWDPETGVVYDYKFTKKPGRGISKRQQEKIYREGPIGITSIKEVNP